MDDAEQVHSAGSAQPISTKDMNLCPFTSYPRNLVWGAPFPQESTGVLLQSSQEHGRSLKRKSLRPEKKEQAELFLWVPV